MKTLSYEEYQRLFLEQLKAPVYHKHSLKALNKGALFENIKNRYPDCFLMEMGSYSYIGLKPKLSIEVVQETVYLHQKGQIKKIQTHYHSFIQQMLQSHKMTSHKDLPPFVCGAIGFISYDHSLHLNKVESKCASEKLLPSIYLRFYEELIIIDHQDKSYYLINIPSKDKKNLIEYEKATKRLQDLDDEIKELSQSPAVSPPLNQLHLTLEKEISDLAFEKEIIKAKQWMDKENVFKLTLLRTFYQAPIKDSWALFKNWQKKRATQTLFYMQYQGQDLMAKFEGSFISLKRPRAEMELSHFTQPSYEDEMARRVMAIDLAKGELGVIATPGSIHFEGIESSRQKISCHLQPELNFFTALEKLLPSSHLSGAPKREALKIMDSLENSRRGIFGGLFFCIDFRGHLKSFSGDQILWIQNQRLTIKPATSIYLDTDPYKEILETYQRANVILGQENL